MTYDEPMTASLLRALYAAADVCRRCEAEMRAPSHPDADFVRKWLRDLGDTISNAASDASNKRATFDAVVDGVAPNGMPPHRCGQEAHQNLESELIGEADHIGGQG